MSKRLWLFVAAMGIAIASIWVRYPVLAHYAHESTGLATLLMARIFGGAAALGIAYTMLASLLTARFFARPSPTLGTYPAVTVVKPLHGAELSLLRNLSTFCEQDYPGEVQYVFGVHDAQDAALQVVEVLRLRYPLAKVDVNVDPRLYGPNRKMSNIMNMIPLAQHDVIIFADSDVTVDRDYLSRVVAELAQPGVGLVTCLFHGVASGGVWTRLSAKATNYQFMPSVITGLALNLARPCFGQTIALRRSTLNKIGGFAQFVHHLAEDHAIGEAVRRIGERVVIPPFAVGHVCEETTVTKLIAHELRWSRTIRSITPGAYMGTVLLFPFALSLLALLCSRGAHWAFVIAALSLIARQILKICCDRSLRLRRRTSCLLPIWDLISFGIFLLSFFSSQVIWRGFSYKVGSDGLLYPLSNE
jgi:ceramide glucosyltransferase